jgi:hypothetical protein
MTFKDKAASIGKEATIEAGGLVVVVKILDYKFSYGNDRWLVTPKEGSKKVWMQKITFRKS